MDNRSFLANSARMDASFHLSDGVSAKRALNKSPFSLRTIGSVSEDIFFGNRAKRIYVAKPEFGIPFLSSSDILQADLSGVKLASKKYTPGVEQMKLEEGWILISRSGTIGNTAWTNYSHAQKLASEDVIRVIPNHILRKGFVYAYLSSRFGHALLTQGTYGTVIQHIEPKQVAAIPIPEFPNDFQDKVDSLIVGASSLRDEALVLTENARMRLLKEANLPALTREDYNYLGPKYAGRALSTFSRSIKDLGTISFNAFNYSERVRVNIINRIKAIPHITLKDALDEKNFWSSSGVTVNEVKEGHGIMLINQSDIFDRIVKGKYVAMKAKYKKDLLKQGEVLIAKIGTLGENETFCRCVYVGEELEGQLVSSAFYRLTPSVGIPSGYLYAWLSSDYGFRLLRSSHYGTKQCYPNPLFLNEYPFPVLSTESMNEIDAMIVKAHHLMHLANNKEREAISMVEKEIEKWNS